MSSQDDMKLLAEMMAETSGAWPIKPSRVDLISAHADKLPYHLRNVLQEMLDEARDGDAAWLCTTDRYRAVRALMTSLGRPSQAEASSILEQVVRGAAQDNVLGRPWVQSAIDLIRKIAD